MQKSSGRVILTSLTLACAFVGVMLTAAPASASGAAGTAGGVLTYTGGSENNSVTLSVSSTHYTFTDFGAGTVTAGPGCTASSGPAGPMPILDCTRSGVTAIVIRTNDGDDVAQVELADVVPDGVTLTIDLGAGDDSWAGHNGADTVVGGSGNDTIDTRDGDDVVHGGDGRNTITGGSGDDQLAGDGDNDTVSGNEGNDTVDGGDGKDRVAGNTGADNVVGGAGDDIVGGGLDSDVVQGGPGNDTLRDDERGQDTPYLSADVRVGGTGVDTADYSYRLSEASPLRLSLDGEANDGASGEGDNIGPDGSVENITGGIESDVIIGSAGANRLSGLEGDDVVSGLGGKDTITGDSNNDRLKGGGGRDDISGGWGYDTLIGGGGRDALSGGVDNDLIKAKDGAVDGVSCGGGTDRAKVDRGDKVSSLCEVVVR